MRVVCPGEAQSLGKGKRTKSGPVVDPVNRVCDEKL